ncbi:uncharacterized protein TrAFT101_009105 [Trichoderma asperellum]|uniref:uncharacterized protein n=1 Tax=Trichoderma asperellum TaxID=101201 RepID=UPI003321622F|nr:hypothetical protein TrAFT101_009105 [Trichoderma asperellum]
MLYGTLLILLIKRKITYSAERKGSGSRRIPLCIIWSSCAAKGHQNDALPPMNMIYPSSFANRNSATSLA